jgi:hypothetical protein
VFPELLVRFDCGNTEFALSETELYPLIARPFEGVFDADARRPACDREFIGEGLILHPENVLSFRTRFSVEGIYTDISSSRGNDGLADSLVRDQEVDGSNLFAPTIS